MEIFHGNVSILVENSTYLPYLKAEHGWAVLIQNQNESILFDTGQSTIFMDNAQIMNKDLAAVSKVVLSHGHYDHTGGLEGFLAMNSFAEVYAHPDIFKQRFSVRSLKEGKTIGIPENVLKFREQFTLSTRPTQINSWCLLTGQIPRLSESPSEEFFNDLSRRDVDYIFDDQALVLDTIRGLVIVLGCCHSGLQNTLDYVTQLTGSNKIYMIIGGMHLSQATNNDLNDVVKLLMKYSVERIGIAHCTGFKSGIALQQAFPKKVFLCSAGTQITF